MIAVSAIGASVASILTDNNKKKVEKIKVQAIKDLRKTFSSPEAENDINKMVNGILKNIRDYVDSACDDMNSALAQDIKDTEDSIQQIIDESKLAQEEKDKQMKARNEASSELREIRKEALNICGEYRITDIAVS